MHQQAEFDEQAAHLHMLQANNNVLTAPSIHQQTLHIGLCALFDVKHNAAAGSVLSRRCTAGHASRRAGMPGNNSCYHQYQVRRTDVHCEVLITVEMHQQAVFAEQAAHVNMHLSIQKYLMATAVTAAHSCGCRWDSIYSA